MAKNLSLLLEKRNPLWLFLLASKHGKVLIIELFHGFLTLVSSPLE
jgi:hypothetical protein